MDMLGRMPARPLRTGVCVVRAEALSTGTVITIRTNVDVDRPCDERVEVVSDVANAVRSVEAFLTRYLRES
jgi:hypothetical protein